MFFRNAFFYSLSRYPSVVLSMFSSFFRCIDLSPPEFCIRIRQRPSMASAVPWLFSLSNPLLLFSFFPHLDSPSQAFPIENCHWLVLPRPFFHCEVFPLSLNFSAYGGMPRPPPFTETRLGFSLTHSPQVCSVRLLCLISGRLSV